MRWSRLGLGALVCLGCAWPALADLVSTNVQADVVADTAFVKVQQSFDQLAGGKPLAYRLRLPGGGRVDRLQAEIDDRRLDTRLCAGLVAAPGGADACFEAQLGTLPAGVPLTIEISYSQRVSWVNGKYRLALPRMATITQQVAKDDSWPSAMYGGGGFSGSGLPPGMMYPARPPEGSWYGQTLTSQKCVADVTINLPGPLTLNEDELPGAKITSGLSATSVHIEHVAATSADMVIVYEPDQGTAGMAVTAHGGYMALTILPPAVEPALAGFRRRVLFALDLERGAQSDATARQALAAAVGALAVEDSFAVVDLDRPRRDPVTVFGSAAPYLGRPYESELLATPRTPVDIGELTALLTQPAAADEVTLLCLLTNRETRDYAELASLLERHHEVRVEALALGSGGELPELERLASLGRGEVSHSAYELPDRLRRPRLTDLSLDWGELAVREVCPQRLPDMIRPGPITVCARYERAAKGVVTLRGRQAGKPFERQLEVDLPAPARGPNVAGVWARARADMLVRDLQAQPVGANNGERVAQIQALGREFGIVTPFSRLELLATAAPDTPLAYVSGPTGALTPDLAGAGLARRFGQPAEPAAPPRDGCLIIETTFPAMPQQAPEPSPPPAQSRAGTIDFAPTEWAKQTVTLDCTNTNFAVVMDRVKAQAGIEYVLTPGVDAAARVTVHWAAKDLAAALRELFTQARCVGDVVQDVLIIKPADPTAPLRPAAPPPPITPTVVLTQERPELWAKLTVNLDYTATAFGTVLAEAKRQTGIEYVLSPGVDEHVPVTLHMVKKDLAAALRELLPLAGCTAVELQGVLIVKPARQQP